MQGLALDTKWAMTRQLVLESLLRRSLGQKSATYLQAIPSILQVMLQAKSKPTFGDTTSYDDENDQNPVGQSRNSATSKNDFAWNLSGLAKPRSNGGGSS